MPLTKVEQAVHTAKMLPKSELGSLSHFDLMVQKLIRENVYKTLVGTLYTSILADEISYIEQLLENTNA